MEQLKWISRVICSQRVASRRSFSPPVITVALWEVSAPIMRNTCWLTRIENTTRWESDCVCSWTCHLFQEASAVTAPRKHPGSKHCPCASTIRAGLSDSVIGSLDGLPVIPRMMPLVNCWSLRLAFVLQRWSDFSRVVFAFPIPCEEERAALTAKDSDPRVPHRHHLSSALHLRCSTGL